MIEPKRYNDMIKTVMDTYCVICVQDKSPEGCLECRRLMLEATEEEVKEIFKE